MEEQGIKVDIALNTDEGLGLAAKHPYELIISDIGRPEGERAGIDFTQKLRVFEKNTPIYIYCGSWAAQNLRSAALSAGATEITSSGTTLLGLVFNFSQVL